MKKVSIIVPVYNMEKYLNKCMDSLVNQTLDDIEIIAINDGSKDASLNMLKEYERKYSDKVKIINQENQGISVTRNNGIEIARGKYIAFLDSDDYVTYDMYEKMYNKLEETNADIVVCDYEHFITDNKTFKYINVVENIHKDNLYDDPSIINSIDYGPCNKLFRRELFRDIRFLKNIKYEDLNAILKAFLTASKITTIDESLYMYRINETGETRTINKKVKDILVILQDLIDYSKSINTFDKIKKELRELAVNKCFFYLISSYKINDAEFSFQFRKEIICFLNKNFKSWKLELLKNKSLEIKFISKLVLINNFVFRYFINRKCS